MSSFTNEEQRLLVSLGFQHTKQCSCLREFEALEERIALNPNSLNAAKENRVQEICEPQITSQIPTRDKQDKSQRNKSKWNRKHGQKHKETKESTTQSDNHITSQKNNQQEYQRDSKNHIDLDFDLNSNLDPIQNPNLVNSPTTRHSTIEAVQSESEILGMENCTQFQRILCEMFPQLRIETVQEEIEQCSDIDNLIERLTSIQDQANEREWNKIPKRKKANIKARKVEKSITIPKEAKLHRIQKNESGVEVQSGKRTDKVETTTNRHSTSEHEDDISSKYFMFSFFLSFFLFVSAWVSSK